MRPNIGRHFLGSAAAVAVVVAALCLGWPVDDGVTQADDAADGAILTVRTCIGVNAKGRSLEETLIEEDIIEGDLLQTKVTSGMCREMLDQVPDGTPAQKLVAAQNYMQETELIEGAMKEAAGEAATRGLNGDSSSDGSLDLFRTIAHTSEQVPALAQYDGPGGGTEVIEPRRRQAAAAASVGEDADAPIRDRLDQKVAALREEGASATEADAGGHCSLEVDVLDEEMGKNEGLWKISPLMPEKMRHRETKRAGLLVSPVTRERLQEIRRKQGTIAEASEFGIGCVELTDRMKAQIVPDDLNELVVDPQQSDDIRELSSNRNTLWSWDVTARQKGKLDLQLDLLYAISREGQEYRLIPGSPIYEGEIKVTPLQGESTQERKEPPWWRRIFGGVLERISGLFGG